MISHRRDVAGVVKNSPAVLTRLMLLMALTPVLGQTMSRAEETTKPAEKVAVAAPTIQSEYRDLAYVSNGHSRQKLDLYLPASSGAPHPLIIWIHGGGWRGGSKDQCFALRAGFRERGYAVASIGYRLSGDALYPAQIEDCKAAVRWLRAHAKDYNLDPNRFAVWGSSAGGHLAALVGTTGEVKDFDKGDNLKVSSKVQAVCDFYGPTDFSNFVITPGYESHANSTSPESLLLGGAVLDSLEKAKTANPITYVSAKTPPFFIVHGGTDRVVPPQQSDLLHEALKKAKVTSTYHFIADAGHGGPQYNQSSLLDKVDSFFKQHLKIGSADKSKS